MTIVTKAPKRDIYVRIWPSSITSSAKDYSGCVGKVVSEADMGEGKTAVVVNIAGCPEVKIFNGCDVQLISKKTYFTEALRGG